MPQGGLHCGCDAAAQENLKGAGQKLEGFFKKSAGPKDANKP